MTLHPAVDAQDARALAQQAVRDLRGRIERLDDDAIDLILRDARNHYKWTDRPVPTGIIEQAYQIAARGPTSMNSCPARFIFVTSQAGKDKLAKSLKPLNIPKMQAAPITIILAYDLEFWTHLPVLFPHEDRTHFFRDKPEFTQETAFRNSTLQGGYFMVAARALGLDIGAMSGFDNAIVDAEFFAGTSMKSNFLINMGYADESALFQRLPRFAFEDACKFV